MILNDKQIRQIPTLGFAKTKQMLEDLEQLVYDEAKFSEQVDLGASEELLQKEMTDNMARFLEKYFQ